MENGNSGITSHSIKTRGSNAVVSKTRATDYSKLLDQLTKTKNKLEDTERVIVALLTSHMVNREVQLASPYWTAFN
jgi:hypothetical protein